MVIISSDKERREPYHIISADREKRILYAKKNQIFMFPCCSTREDLFIDVSITIVGLILTKLG